MSTPASAPVRPVPGLAAAFLAVVTAVSACSSETFTSTAPSALTRCGVTLSTSETTLPPEGGTGRVTVSTARECVWTARSEATWLSITGAASGQGDGAVDYRAAANPDPLVRRGAVVLNDMRAEVVQAAGACTFSLRNSSASFGQAGGTGSVALEASSGLCSWTAGSDADWLRITSPTSGQGSATITFQVLSTTGPPRTATLTIAGQRFEVTQAEGCTFSVSPGEQSFDAAGGTGSVAVSAGPACPWTASSNVEWITVTGGTSGTGPGTVTYSVSARTGAPRTGSLTVAGQTVTVTQSQGCSYSIVPDALTVAASGGSGEVAVTAPAGCPWTATAAAGWITITQGAAGSGNGIVRFTVAASSGPARTGVLTIAGRTFTVTQGQACTVSLAPDRVSVPAAGGPGSVSVTAGAGCAWSAASQQPWITITSGASGSGNGSVGFSVASNPGTARSGTIVIAGLTFTIEQSGQCAFEITPREQTIGSAGGTITVAIAASAANCAWTAASEASWISITQGNSGTGSGSVRLAIAANTGPARSGTVRIAGETFRVDQASGCSYALSPQGRGAPPTGGSNSFGVATTAGCSWAAVSQAPWLTVVGDAKGIGSGTVQYTVQPNTTGEARTGTIMVEDMAFTVTQNSGGPP